MKSRLSLQRPAIFCLFGISLATAVAQGFPQRGNLPSESPGFYGMGGGMPAPARLLTAPDVDPATGLPIGRKSDYPDLVLTNVAYNDLPMSEVVADLRERFKDSFDILPLARDRDWSYNVNLHLKNVRASEVFNAMNLVFENERAPFRWEYGMNGSRFTAIVRMLPQADAGMLPAQFPAEPPPAPKKPMVFFVGNLIDNGKDGMTMETLAKTLSEVSKMAYNDDVSLSFHNEAQIMVVKGTEEQIGFIRDTLMALRGKEQERLRNAAKSKAADAKSSGADAVAK